MSLLSLEARLSIEESRARSSGLLTPVTHRVYQDSTTTNPNTYINVEREAIVSLIENNFTLKIFGPVYVNYRDRFIVPDLHYRENDIGVDGISGVIKSNGEYFIADVKLGYNGSESF